MYKSLLCLRYLRTRYIALASIISVMLGVATMIVVNSVMAGFSTEMRDRIHGILADVIIETNSLDGVDHPERWMTIARNAAPEHIKAMTATVEVYGMVSFQWNGHWMTRPITLIGIQPESKSKVGPLVDNLESYNPVMDGDVVVRTALRSRDEPPGWELTEPAMAYLKDKIEREEQFREQLNNIRRSAEAPTESRSPFDLRSSSFPRGGGANSQDNEAIGMTASTKELIRKNPVDERGPFHKDHLDTESPVGSEFPFSPVVSKVDLEQEEAIWPARVYVGSGLIEFQFEDKLGKKIRVQRMIQPGDEIKISTVSAGRPPEARHFNATVVDVFKSGMSEYDSNLIFCNLEYLQEIRGMIAPETGVRSVTSIQIKLKDYTLSKEVVRQLKAVFPPRLFTVRTWEQKQGPLLAAVEIETAILNVLLFLIIAVAGFGILAIFYMIVVEKTRDIGILKALGASSRGVMTIFLSYGLALGIVGSGVGVALGLLFVYYINEIEDFLTVIIGRKVFDEAIYYFPAIPTFVNPMTVIWVAVGAMAIAVLASILPARRAAQLHPVEALRYE